jgi:hypothetical protein
LLKKIFAEALQDEQFLDNAKVLKEITAVIKNPRLNKAVVRFLTLTSEYSPYESNDSCPSDSIAASDATLNSEQVKRSAKRLITALMRNLYNAEPHA